MYYGWKQTSWLSSSNHAPSTQNSEALVIQRTCMEILSASARSINLNTNTIHQTFNHGTVLSALISLYHLFLFKSLQRNLEFLLFRITPILPRLLNHHRQWWRGMLRVLCAVVTCKNPYACSYFSLDTKFFLKTYACRLVSLGIQFQQRIAIY